MGDFQRGKYTKPMAFDGFWKFFLLLKIKRLGRLFREIRPIQNLMSDSVLRIGIYVKMLSSLLMIIIIFQKYTHPSGESLISHSGQRLFTYVFGGLRKIRETRAIRDMTIRRSNRSQDPGWIWRRLNSKVEAQTRQIWHILQFRRELS